MNAPVMVELEGETDPLEVKFHSFKVCLDAKKSFIAFPFQLHAIHVLFHIQ